MAIPLYRLGANIGIVRIEPFDTVESPGGGTIGNIAAVGGSTVAGVENVLARYEFRPRIESFRCVGWGSGRVHNEADVYDLECSITEIDRRTIGTLGAIGDAFGHTNFSGPQFLTLWQLLNLHEVPAALTQSHLVRVTIVTSTFPTATDQQLQFMANWVAMNNGPASISRTDTEALFVGVDDNFRDIAQRQSFFTAGTNV